MIRLFTVSKKGGNIGAMWNGVHPEKFFPLMHSVGVKKIWDVCRSPNGQYGSFFDTDIMKWCCEHDGIEFNWHLDFVPKQKVFYSLQC